MKARVLATLGALMMATTAHTAEPGSVWDGAYNAAQVKRGNALYAKICETCHGPKLDGSEGPPLAGADFLANWYGYTVGDLLEKTRNTMPQTDPKSLSAQEYTDLLALMLSANKFPAGDAELPTTPDRQKQIRIEAAKPPAK
jgi:mono/diheme cytochrome c family protein